MKRTIKESLSQLLSLIKEICWFLFAITGSHHFFRWINRKKILILTYHGVVKEPLFPSCWTQVTVSSMVYQLRYMKKNYHIIKLSELLSLLDNGMPLANYTAVITFDDGYKNNYTLAYPLLKKMSVPASIFLTTGCISNNTLCWFDQLYLGIKNTAEKKIDLNKYGIGLHPLLSLSQKEYAFENIVIRLKEIPPMEKDIIL